MFIFNFLALERVVYTIKRIVCVLHRLLAMWSPMVAILVTCVAVRNCVLPHVYGFKTNMDFFFFAYIVLTYFSFHVL